MTKAELAQRILRLLGINSRFVEADPTQVQDVLKYTNDWILSLSAVGARLGWNSDDGEPNPNDETGLPDWAIQGVTCGVAKYCAPYFDKPIHEGIRTGAAMGMQTIYSRTVENYETPYPNRMPRGHGNRTLYGKRWYPETDPIETEGDLLEDEGGEVITS